MKATGFEGENRHMAAYVLKLFIVGKSQRAEQSIGELRRMLEQKLSGKFDLIIIDVLEQPGLAEEEKIMATPTLIKTSPPPRARVIGDFTDTQKVLMGLNL